MAISWGAIDKKTIETGVDRGVLYTGAVSVPWDGLISVTEKTEDKVLNQHYYQGIVYHVSKDPGNFSASLEAFSYPPEFESFQGMYEVESGLFADNQAMYRTFDFSYRSLIADGLSGLQAGYKIHLIYNAIAVPTEMTRNTINDSISADNFTWDIMCSAKPVTGMRPTSHFIVDSRRLTRAQLVSVENLIYGSVGASSPVSLPSVVDVSNRIINPDPLLEVSPGVYEVQYTPSGWTEVSPGVYDVAAFPFGWTEVLPAVWEEPNV